MDNILSHFLRIFHKRRNPLIWRIPFIKTCQAISISICVIVFFFFFFFLTPFAGVKVFFFLVHLCSSLQGTLCNLYSLLFFLIIIEENVSFRMGEKLEIICIWFYFMLKKKIGVFLVIFVFVFVFSPIFKKRKRKRKTKCCFSKSFKSKFFMLLLSK